MNKGGLSPIPLSHRELFEKIRGKAKKFEMLCRNERTAGGTETDGSVEITRGRNDRPMVQRDDWRSWDARTGSVEVAGKNISIFQKKSSSNRHIQTSSSTWRNIHSFRSRVFTFLLNFFSKKSDGICFPVSSQMKKNHTVLQLLMMLTFCFQIDISLINKSPLLLEVETKTKLRSEHNLVRC